MQDSARSHRIEQMFSFLHEYIGGRVITLGYPKYTGAGMDWHQYSPDLIPYDYFLWGTLKDIVYRNNPTTLDELEQSICAATESISVQTLQNVMTHFVARLRHLSSVSGYHFEHIVM